ncbi:TetR/AcrR family transcriptional regulator [Kribbella sp. NPDC051770]|uniref:TetR/AcrR family transcriptional regulator n=1 Tax=Kribbella sp. NPDC051770 TaxID=3155413 RepID=UPI003427AFB1
MAEQRARKARVDGERSRQAIVTAAAGLATVQGIDGLSIGGLADHVGMSKSGVYAHFGSKLELQLAAIEAANAVFAAEVVEPAMALTAPLERLRALCENFLDHVGREVFPGGCFFASAVAEMGARTGTVADVVAEAQLEWMAVLTDQITAAQADGSLAGDLDPDQLAFELESALYLANSLFVLHRRADVLDRARRAVAGLLDRS